MFGTVPTEKRADWYRISGWLAASGQGRFRLEEAHFHWVYPALSVGSLAPLASSVKSSVSSTGIRVQYRTLLVSGMGIPTLPDRHRPPTPKCESARVASRSRSC